MSNLVVAHAYRLQVACTNNEQASVNSIYYTASSVVGTVTTAQFAAAASTLLAPLYKATFTINTRYNGCSVQDVSIPARFSPDVGAGGAGFGALAAPDMPRQTAAIVSFQTGLIGRSNRGRTYIPFPAGTLNSNQGVPSAGAILLYAALAAQLVVGFAVGAGLNNATLVPIIWHKKSSTFTFVTTGFAETVWGTQRRRGSFGRPNKSPI